MLLRATAKAGIKSGEEIVTLRGRGLPIDEVARVAREGSTASISHHPEIRNRVTLSHEAMLRSGGWGHRICGVTTALGSMSNIAVSPDQMGTL